MALPDFAGCGNFCVLIVPVIVFDLFVTSLFEASFLSKGLTSQLVDKATSLTDHGRSCCELLPTVVGVNRRFYCSTGC